jgi:CRISPR-associated endonuclease/helicase Cas3
MRVSDIREEKREFYAHSLPGRLPQEWQKLEDHLLAVARLAKQFGDEFGAGEWGYLAGFWHDLGKYSDDFQRMLRLPDGEDAHIEDRPSRVDHSTAGAILIEKAYAAQFRPLERVLAYSIAGHHAGLSNWIAGLDERLKKIDRLKKVYDRIPRKIRDHAFPQERPKAAEPPNPLTLSLWIRMIFSCVIDADFLDTEIFIAPEKGAARKGYPDPSTLLSLFNGHIKELIASSPKTLVNKIRDIVRKQCIAKSQESPAIFTLTVPTGGGKTLSSMAFALNHAVKFKKRRIIYVIPYTSIVEQTVDVFRQIFGEAVIEHHSNVDETDADAENCRSRLACENWDAPIIVTTAVQFFESLFASKTSKCRKLHNIVNSVLILDEAQLLPPDLLIPIIEVIKELRANYGVTIVLSTATQPAFAPRSGADFDFPGIPDTIEIMDSPGNLHESLKRVQFIIRTKTGISMSWPEVARELQNLETVLCIVNSRKDCRTLYRLMPSGTIHLSALMCGAHRSKVIDEIKKRLKDGISTRVISTQLVEAGVDFDFPVVYRALAGLDEIVQAAGRCNREGSELRGRVVVFIPPSEVPPGHLRQAAEVGRRLLGALNNDDIPLHTFTEFFRELYWIKGKDLDRHQVISLLKNDPKMRYSFRTAAESFRIIDRRGYPCLVRYGEGDELIDRLCALGKERFLMRKLQRYTVQVTEWHLRRLLASGEVAEPEVSPGLYMQVSTLLYQNDIGLFMPEEAEAFKPGDLII